jgi:hypothetical protein
MASTLAVNIHIINGTNSELTFTNSWSDPGDWEIAPKFPDRVAPSTRLVVKAEANYYRKTVPFSVSVGCDGQSFDITKYDPYHDAWSITTQETQGMMATMVVGPSATTGRYDVLILVTGTKYNT